MGKHLTELKLIIKFKLKAHLPLELQKKNERWYGIEWLGAIQIDFSDLAVVLSEYAVYITEKYPLATQQNRNNKVYARDLNCFFSSFCSADA